MALQVCPPERYPCVDGPLGSRAMLQNRRRVRVRSCVRPCGAVEMTAAQMGSASEPSTRLRFRTAPLDGTGYLARRFDRSSSAVALSPAMPAVQAAVAGRYASPLVIMAHTTRAILLARATAASLRGRRRSRASSQALAWRLPGL